MRESLFVMLALAVVGLPSRGDVEPQEDLQSAVSAQVSAALLKALPDQKAIPEATRAKCVEIGRDFGELAAQLPRDLGRETEQWIVESLCAIAANRSVVLLEKPQARQILISDLRAQVKVVSAGLTPERIPLLKARKSKLEKALADLRLATVSELGGCLSSVQAFTLELSPLDADISPSARLLQALNSDRVGAGRPGGPRFPGGSTEQLAALERLDSALMTLLLQRELVMLFAHEAQKDTFTTGNFFSTVYWQEFQVEPRTFEQIAPQFKQALGKVVKNEEGHAHVSVRGLRSLAAWVPRAAVAQGEMLPFEVTVPSVAGGIQFQNSPVLWGMFFAEGKKP